MSTQDRVNRECYHPPQHRSMADALDVLAEQSPRRVLIEAALRDRDQARDLLAACNPCDVLALATAALMYLKEPAEVQPNRAQVAFAVRDVPACISGWLDDRVRDAE